MITHMSALLIKVQAPCEAIAYVVAPTVTICSGLYMTLVFEVAVSSVTDDNHSEGISIAFGATDNARHAASAKPACHNNSAARRRPPHIFLNISTV